MIYWLTAADILILKPVVVCRVFAKLYLFYISQQSVIRCFVSTVTGDLFLRQCVKDCSRFNSMGREYCSGQLGNGKHPVRD